MKKIFFTTFTLFFFYTAISQNPGDRSSVEIFDSQPTWDELSSKDRYDRMRVMDFIECRSTDEVLFWNELDGRRAEAQVFKATDTIRVARCFSCQLFAKYPYKDKCTNMLRYIRILAKKEEPKEKKPVTIRDTIYETVVVKKEVVQPSEKEIKRGPCRVNCTTGYIDHGHPEGELCVSYFMVGDCNPPPPLPTRVVVRRRCQPRPIQGAYRTCGAY